MLRSVASRVELLAVTDRQELSLVADDGMQTAGDAIAAMVVQLGGRTISGLKMVDEVLELDPVLATNRSEESWKSSPRPAEVKVSIPVASVRSESERMDRLMRQALKAAKYPNITYQLSSSSFTLCPIPG